MPYISPEVIEQARQIDLLTYLRRMEPDNVEQVKGTRNVYRTVDHDSLKISNGKWFWWSQGFGGYTALDYLIKVRNYSFMDAVEILTGKELAKWTPPPKKEEKTEPKALRLPEKYQDSKRVMQYLFDRGIDYQIIQECIADGVIFESNGRYHNAVFVGKDETGTLLDDKELSDEERSEYIATLQTSLEKLTFLTNSLIKMSRLESGIISLKPEKNNLNDIVLQAVKTVYAKAKEKNITITFDCERQFEALLDYNWTAEAITNVLDNAVKYTPSGGIVGLEITEYPSYLRLDISDNGIGIPEEEQAKIFGRFYRGKQSAGIDGVGIGLYLTRDIINKQKGYIKVASDENGSIFSLFLKKD